MKRCELSKDDCLTFFCTFVVVVVVCLFVCFVLFVFCFILFCFCFVLFLFCFVFLRTHFSHGHNGGNGQCSTLVNTLGFQYNFLLVGN